MITHNIPSRPREEYLKHTIGEMNVSKQLSSAIEHGMFDTLLDIKRNFMANEGGLLQQGLPVTNRIITYSFLQVFPAFFYIHIQLYQAQARPAFI